MIVHQSNSLYAIQYSARALRNHPEYQCRALRPRVKLQDVKAWTSRIGSNHTARPSFIAGDKVIKAVDGLL